jgi:hypothetical protein
VSYRRFPEKVHLGWLWIVVALLLFVVVYRLFFW